jgi:ferric-dicitrate binding protein FerR (iron transport regulator)
MYSRKLLACLLVLLLAFPAWANPTVVGSVVRSEAASVQGVRLATGSTLYSGDTIHVDAGGAARIALPDGALIQLTENSLVQLARNDATTQLIVDRGSLAFRSTEKSPVEALLGDATIRSADDNLAVGIIQMRGPDAAVIMAEKGRLSIQLAHDGSLTTLREGEGMEVRLVADTAEAQSGPTPAGRSRRRRVILLAIILAGAMTAIALLLANQEPELNNCNAVSPFRCP